MTADCEIKTLSVNDYTEPCLAQQCTLNKVILQAGEFVDLLSDLDNDSDELELVISPDYPNLKLTSCGVSVSAIIILKFKFRSFFF